MGILLGATVAVATVFGVFLSRDDPGESVESPSVPPTAQTLPSSAVTTPVPTADEQRAVRQTLTTFFTSIEAGNYETAFNLRSWEPHPGGVSRDEALAGFIDDYGTTTYEPDIMINNFRYDGADILVDVTFTSHQALAKAPPGGGPCTRWELYSRMEQSEQMWLIGDSKARGSQKYYPC